MPRDIPVKPLREPNVSAYLRLHEESLRDRLEEIGEPTSVITTSFDRIIRHTLSFEDLSQHSGAYAHVGISNL